MGKNNNEQTDQQRRTLTNVTNAATDQWREQGATPNALTNEMVGHSQNMMNNYNTAAATGMKDYGDIMGRYNTFREGLKAPQISAARPGELNESYGYLREAMPGYRDFASTGGYSGQDVQELRARGMAPIRSAYGNTMRELDRSRALGGNQGQYVAALSRAQRELPEQLSGAMTNVNAGLAESIRQGKMFGLGGMTGTGQAMGGLSSQDAQRQLQAAMSNQDAEMQANNMRLNAIGGQASLYGTAPGMASTFGNQALNAYQNAGQMDAARQNYGLGLLDAQLRAANPNMQQQHVPWWQQALGIAGTAAGAYAGAASDRNIKKNIRKMPEPVSDKLRRLPIYKWQYKGDKTTHMGPMAQEFKRIFGVGDGKTLHAADVFGVVLASQKEAIAHA